MTPIIQYSLLAEAQKYYGDLGYVEISVPWIVSKKAQNLSKPSDGRRDYKTLDGYLNASGEQGFYELMLQNRMPPPGKYMTVTSCFRDEPELDDYHYKYFVKLELIDTTRDAWDEFYRYGIGSFFRTQIVTEAKDFFNNHLKHDYDFCRAIAVNLHQVDLETDRQGIELGSYGARETTEGFRWVFGTGLALPRFSQVLLDNCNNPKRVRNY